jgi:hypothetical protein
VIDHPSCGRFPSSLSIAAVVVDYLVGVDRCGGCWSRGGGGCPRVIAGEYETTGPHPSGRGGAQVGLGSEGAYRGRRRWWKTNPHPSIEGRGSLPARCGWFRASCGGEGGGEDGSGGGGMNQYRP